MNDTNHELTEMQRMELAAAHEFVLDNEDKPEDWESLIDEAHLHTLRQEIMHWSFDELAAYCQALDVWEDPTRTKAVLDVIESKLA
jgi:hypothetical protein